MIFIQKKSYLFLLTILSLCAQSSIVAADSSDAPKNFKDIVDSRTFPYIQEQLKPLFKVGNITLSRILLKDTFFENRFCCPLFGRRTVTIEKSEDAELFYLNKVLYFTYMELPETKRVYLYTETNGKTRAVPEPREIENAKKLNEYKIFEDINKIIANLENTWKKNLTVSYHYQNTSGFESEIIREETDTVTKFYCDSEDRGRIDLSHAMLLSVGEARAKKAGVSRPKRRVVVLPSSEYGDIIAKAFTTQSTSIMNALSK